jgi:hypothetical protein
METAKQDDEGELPHSAARSSERGEADVTEGEAQSSIVGGPSEIEFREILTSWPDANPVVFEEENGGQRVVRITGVNRSGENRQWYFIGRPLDEDGADAPYIARGEYSTETQTGSLHLDPIE